MTKNRDHPDSVWRAMATGIGTFAALDGDRDTDVLIIGGGFTGLSTARDLLARNIDCVVLEGRDIGSGASGRTGGFAVPRYKTNFSTLARIWGDDTAKDLFHQVIEAVESISETIETFRISCGFQRDGHLTPAHSRTALAGLEADAAWLRNDVGDNSARILSAGETAEALGTNIYQGAYIDPRGGCIQPYDYVHGLAKRLAESGVPVFVGTLVETVRREHEVWIAETSRGQVRARSIVLATNAHTRPLTPRDDLYRRVVPVASSVITTRPLSSQEAKKTLPAKLPVTDTRRIVRYFRMLPTGQLLFGGRGDITGRRNDPTAYRSLEQQLASVFPHLKGIDIQERWSGMVAVTSDGFPHIGQLDEQLFFAVGYGGRGVALTSLMGRRLGALIAGEAVSSGPMGDHKFRPIPFHRWRRTGMRAMAKYYQFRDFIER